MRKNANFPPNAHHTSAPLHSRSSTYTANDGLDFRLNEYFTLHFHQLSMALYGNWQMLKFIAFKTKLFIDVFSILYNL